MNTNDKELPKKKSSCEILKYTAAAIRETLENLDTDFEKSLQEIRLRAGKPLMLYDHQGDWFVDCSGSLEKKSRNPVIVTQDSIVKTLELMSENSIYAYQDEIKNGFITLKGGHRVGVCGRVVLEGQAVKNLKDVSGLCIRLARQVRGCSREIIKHLTNKAGGIYNVLIVSPPQCGKTTILRDLTRIISNGDESAGITGQKFGIVDERSEIAACFKGIPQNDVGIRTDVLDGCPKAAGMAMMLRSMSPEVIVTDEIGNAGDRDAVMQVVNAGVKIITTAHGYNISELKTRREVLSLIEEKVFERYIVLSKERGPGTLEEVIDGQTMKPIYIRTAG